MTSITPDDIRHTALLARLHIEEKDIDTRTQQIGAILDYVAMLQEVDTSGIDTALQVTGAAHVVRDDVLREEELASPDALLACSPLPVIDHQIQTPSAHG